MDSGAGRLKASSSSNGGRTRVGKYELGKTLGEGNFAKVKFARNSETGESVAIKILDKEKVLKHKMIGQVFFYFLCLLLLWLHCLANLMFGCRENGGERR